MRRPSTVWTATKSWVAIALLTMMVVGDVKAQNIDVTPATAFKHILKHLSEKHGYSLTSISGTSTESYAATRDGKIAFFVSLGKEGVFFRKLFNFTAQARGNMSGFYELINKLNQKSFLVRYYPAEDVLVLEGHYKSPFDAGRFDAFLREWEKDLGRLNSTENASLWIVVR